MRVIDEDRRRLAFAGVHEGLRLAFEAGRAREAGTKTQATYKLNQATDLITDAIVDLIEDAAATSRSESRPGESTP